MKKAVSEEENPNFLKMHHGKLEINVPRRMFKSSTAEAIPSEVEKFRDTISTRYPWLSKHALDEVIKEAQQAMVDFIEDHKSPPQKARELMARERYRDALRLLERRLIEDPDDADTWYVTSEVLFKMGRVEEGFNAMNRARQLALKPSTVR